MNQFNSVGIEGFNGVSIATVILPVDISREEYIDYCFSNGVLMVFDNELKGVVRNVSIDQELIQQIKFPLNQKDTGSQIIYCSTPLNNNKFVLRVLKTRDSFQYLKQNSFKTEKTYDGVTVTLFGKAEEGEFDIVINSNKDKVVKMNITVDGNKDSELNLSCNGSININNFDILKMKDKSGSFISVSKEGVEVNIDKENLDAVMKLIGDTDNITLNSELQNILRKMVIQIQACASALGIASAAELSSVIETEYLKTKGKVKTS
jgi:hypothetical protein